MPGRSCHCHHKEGDRDVDDSRHYAHQEGRAVVPKLPGLQRVSGSGSGHQVALRQVGNRVHRAPRADLLHGAGLLFRTRAGRHDGGAGGTQRVRGRRRRSPGHELSLLDLLRHQQEGPQHPGGPAIPRGGQPCLGADRPPVRRSYGADGPALSHDGNSVECPSFDPQAVAAGARRDQGGDPSGLPLLQGVPG